MSTPVRWTQPAAACVGVETRPTNWGPARRRTSRRCHRSTACRARSWSSRLVGTILHADHRRRRRVLGPEQLRPTRRRHAETEPVNSSDGGWLGAWGHSGRCGREPHLRGDNRRQPRVLGLKRIWPARRWHDGESIHADSGEGLLRLDVGSVGCHGVNPWIYLFFQACAVCVNTYWA